MAFQPKTRQCYIALFRVFVAFCVCVNAPLFAISVECILSFLEYLSSYRVSVHMLANYISAVKAMGIIYGLHVEALDDRRVKYFIKSRKVNRQFAVVKRNIMDISTLKQVIQVCMGMSNPRVYKALFLCVFFGFFQLSNLTPHTVNGFDPLKQFSGGDVIFGNKKVVLLLKWSKTLQDRDQVRSVVLPKLHNPLICPVRVLQGIFQLYNPSPNEPFFQYPSPSGWIPLTDSRVRKHLLSINLAMSLPKNFYTFHAFRRSGASLAYQSNASIQQIKDHGTWTSECVWRYITMSKDAGHEVANVFRKTIN